ncbi:MAG: hypothetical protein GY810_31530 [Aureispira sp.]|nr:hypothetical protein [Aureispira sp.]
MSTEKSKLNLFNIIFLAPALILALDLSTQVFSAFGAMDSNIVLGDQPTLAIGQPKLFQQNSDGTMRFMTKNDIVDGNQTFAISVDKMNVFYIGVDNPISIASSVPTQNLSINVADNSGISIENQGPSSYIVNATQPGSATINITNRATNKTYPFQFRVKRIPDPIARLGRKTDGVMKSGEFKAQRGLTAWLDNFDFDAKCSIQSYTMYYTRKRQDPVEIHSTGGRFTGRIATAITSAKPGDQYAFVNVKARCPGDRAGRRINGLSFQIK